MITTVFIFSLRVDISAGDNVRPADRLPSVQPQKHRLDYRETAEEKGDDYENQPTVSAIVKKCNVATIVWAITERRVPTTTKTRPTKRKTQPAISIIYAPPDNTPRLSYRWYLVLEKAGQLRI